MRSCLGTNNSTAKAALRLPMRSGGMELLELNDSYSIAPIVHGFRLLNNEDERIRNIARNALF